MKFLCLAYGREEDWQTLTGEQRQALLARDDVLRARGAFISVLGEATVVTAWEGPPEATAGTYAQAPAPLVGFSLIEAGNIDEANRPRRRYPVRCRWGCDRGPAPPLSTLRLTEE